MTDTAGPGPLIGSGRAADVYALGDGQVLRRYKTAHSCAAEAELMRYLREAGYPVPEVFAVAGPDLVMQRLDGRDMLADLASRPWRAVAHARTLARLHDPNVRPAEAARLRRLAGLAAPTPDAPEPTAGEPGAQKPPHPPGPP
jgi:aminoglycoside phosphotransferase (APT) family kinase protein